MAEHSVLPHQSTWHPPTLLTGRGEDTSIQYVLQRFSLLDLMRAPHARISVGERPSDRLAVVVAAGGVFRQTLGQPGRLEPDREGPMGKVRSLLWAGIAALAIAQAAPATADTVKVGLVLPY